MAHRFTFSQVSRALATAHGVSDARFTAFQARLKHYQKLGFPVGTKTGRGRAAEYTVEHALKLALILELNELGLSPDRARNVLGYNLYRAKMAISHALLGLIHGKPGPMFIHFDPSGLDDLKALDDVDQADDTFHYAGLGQLIENLKVWGPGGIRRIGLINATAFIDVVATELSKNSDVSKLGILADGAIWAGTNDDPDEIGELVE